ncbi:hypothetical protein CDL15_Pgr007584 [Punica granatum]|nr:hypothetical protein CDL15_Pgr007581 [Punica granatum]OWM81546.1 hypothetical protein CDL15_Pgr007584 [Punica granatum]
MLLLLGFLALSHFKPLIIKYDGSGGGSSGLLIPDGSLGWPVIGETLGFLEPHPSTSLGSFLQNHCSKYGKVFKSHLFLAPTVVSCDQELNCFILQNEGALFECSYPKPIHGILGKLSMLVAVGDTHRRLRSAALSLVSVTKSKPQFLNDIERAALEVLGSWRNEDRVLFCEDARKFTFNVIVKQVLGLTPDEPRTRAILHDFVTFMRGLVSIPLYIPGTPYARAVQARQRISSSVRSIMEERRQAGRGGWNATSSDFLEILLGMDTLSDDEKLSFILDSLLGGYETTSLLMSMVVYFLGQSSAAFEQAKLEHQRIRSRKKEDECLSWDDYKKMEFTQKVMNEALRCGNIVKFVHRKALKDVRFKGFYIPRGWKVLPVLSAANLDPTLHANPLQFHPWRWESHDQTSKKFTPFGGGSRCCPGFELAKLEVAFFLHHLLLNFRWKIEDEEEQPIAYPYVEFKTGLALRVESCSNMS